MTSDNDSTRAGWLVLGGLHLLNGTAPLAGSDPVVTVPLAAPLDVAFPANTVVLRWSEQGLVELRGRSVDGSRRGTALAAGTDLFPDMLPGAVLGELLTALTGATGSAGPFVPLFYLSAAPTDGGVAVHVYTQTRFLGEDACFIRLTPEPISVAAVEELTWLPEAVRRHANQFLFLNNHQRYYRKCFAGRELEYKYTLAPPLDIWSTTVELYRRLRTGGLPGYLMEYRDEFQAWDYLNHLFQVTDPEPDRGYVSFIPTTDGKHLVKRKWFADDAFDRRESHTYGVQPEAGMDRYVTDVLGLTGVRLPSFRRVRYDVNFESARSGHVYGIFFDHCYLVDAPDVVLHQCELEYLRSRTAVEPDEDLVLVEMAVIAEWLEGFLREHGLKDQRGYYSKLSFLKDSVAARPELAVKVG